jgi:hypothetical protein
VFAIHCSKKFFFSSSIDRRLPIVKKPCTTTATADAMNRAPTFHLRSGASGSEIFELLNCGAHAPLPSKKDLAELSAGLIHDGTDKIHVDEKIVFLD